MKKLMVLGAGFPQAQLLDAAHELGYHTIVASIPGNYPGFSHADETSFTDISDPQAVYEAAKALHVDGIATCCLDTGIRALGYACDRLGLPGLSEAAALCSGNKWEMKNAFAAAGVSTARHLRVTDTASLEAALDTLTMPVILKAVDLQGSKGIYICRSREEVLEHYPQVMELTRQDFCIIEEFIEGTEFGAQAFIYQGQFLFVLPHGDATYMSGTAVPIGHYVPLDMPQEIYDAAIVETKKAIRAIGLDNCAVNVDLITRNGKVYVIELTGRCGATCLAELVSIYFGVDYFKMIASMAVGEDPLVFFNAREGKNVPNISRMLLCETTGTVRAIRNDVVRDDSIYDLSFIVAPGDRVNRFTNAKDRVGQVIVRGANCRERLQEVLSQITIEVDPS